MKPTPTDIIVDPAAGSAGFLVAAGGTDKVWFYDMKADGYSLDDKRQPIDNNDIDDIINRYHNLGDEIGRKRTEQSFLVDKSEIIKNDYDLSKYF